ncbi:MAG: 3'-5' exonuclease, partial [Dehalobacterium sp.]
MDFVVLDLETTGLDCQKDQVIEIGAVRISHGILCEEFSTLIKPDVAVPEQITELTGIDDDMVRNMPSLPEIIPQLKIFLQGSVIVGHNITFDLGFLRSHIPESFLWLDTIEMAKILLPLEASYSLKELAVSIGIDQVSPFFPRKCR